MYRTIIFGLAAALMMAGKASAQNHLATGTGPEPVTANRALNSAPGAFRQLSPGNQKIAQALFDAQKAEDGGPFGTLEGIARAKQQGSGWGTVFKQMKADGLIRERSLGRIIVGRDKKSAADASGARAVRLERPYRSNIVVTTANGRRVVVGLASPRRRPPIFVYSGGNRATPRGGRKVETARLKPEKSGQPAPPRRIVYRLVTQVTNGQGSVSAGSATLGTPGLAAGHTTASIRANHGGRRASIAHQASQ